MLLCRAPHAAAALQPQQQPAAGRATATPGPAAAQRPPRRLATGRHSTVACLSSSSSSNGSGTSLAEELNSVCNAALQAMLENEEQRVPDLEQRLRALRSQAVEAGDLEADRLLWVVQRMLRHGMAEEASELSGPYAAAVNRLVNQVAGSDWKLGPEAAQQEPQFSTWEDVRKAQERRRAGFDDGGGGGRGGPADTAYYQLLEVGPSASKAEIKASYRQLALRLHPDVNSAPDAAQRFAEVAGAYDVLSDPASRTLYDRFGAEGMKRHAGASSGSGNASRAWDEFKPYKKVNKRTKARDASTASYTSSSDEPGASGSMNEAAGAGEASQEAAASSSGSGAGGAAADRWSGMPQAGAVVEYPLSDVVRDELQDGRTHGVGLLVGRNIDRGDVKRLPEEVLDLCEVEPLRQEETGSSSWVPDELSPSAYVRLGQLRPVAVDSFDQRFDVWVITAQLSEGCGGPELPEEIML